MNGMDDNEYKKLTGELEAISIPKEALSQARLQGIKKVHDKKKFRTRSLKQLVVIAAILCVFVTSIRVSPVFAATVAKIPVLSSLVEMIAYDKGVEDIFKNYYYEELNIVDTKNNLTFTLLGVIADESGMVLSYRLEAPYDISNLNTKDINVVQNDLPIQMAIGYGWYGKENTNIVEDKIEITASEGINYDHPNFRLDFTLEDEHETTFSIPFILKKDIAKSKLYEINKEVEIDDQTIIIQSLKISPLRAEVKLALDQANAMQILQFGELKLLDEKGEEWGKIANGSTGFGDLRKGKGSYFIQSNYFRGPRSLTLHIGKVEALPKGQDYVEIDFENKEVVSVPDLTPLDIEIKDSSTVSFTYPESKENHINELFSSVVDANNQEFYSRQVSQISAEGGYNNSSYTFNMKDKVNPIRLYFWSYPNYLNGSAEIKIPLNERD
ncbi:DUF4179 domain-containing protein [Psychrobacillus sp.]|uniref:DUF4179 domain-containing protein n=1 Tax=Psychrobacillus sp. TaxID=1871623 RepID=UPI0028BD66FB|nr:DUF4179 domain-containing protein [Psychrobacillus sp.]